MNENAARIVAECIGLVRFPEELPRRHKLTCLAGLTEFPFFGIFFDNVFMVDVAQW